MIISPPPPRKRSGGLLDSGLSVRPSVRQHLEGVFVSVAELRNYWADSNEILHTCRGGTLVVHLGKGFVRRRKIRPWDFVKNRQFSEIRYWLRDFVSVAELRNYWADSIEILHTCRGGTLVVHLGISFVRRRKMGPWVFVKNRQFSEMCTRASIIDIYDYVLVNAHIKIVYHV